MVEVVQSFTVAGFTALLNYLFCKYQTSYPYRTLATCGFGRIVILIKNNAKNFVGNKNRLYLPLIKNQTFYYEQS